MNVLDYKNQLKHSNQQLLEIFFKKMQREGQDQQSRDSQHVQGRQSDYVEQRRSSNHRFSLHNIRSKSAIMTNFEYIMANNKEWARSKVQENPDFFKELVAIQKPQFLWIGCADSRVPANQIIGLLPGQLFVHRNVANLVSPSDINVLAVIQYSVQVLKVKDIIVTGHYGCGGVKASFVKHDHGPLEAWLSHIRQLRAKYKNKLTGTQQENENLLVELSVKEQVYNVARIPIVQQAWKDGQDLRIHGLVYRLQDGILKDLGLTLNRITQLPEQYRIIQ